MGAGDCTDHCGLAIGVGGNGGSGVIFTGGGVDSNFSGMLGSMLNDFSMQNRRELRPFGRAVTGAASTWLGPLIKAPHTAGQEKGWELT